MNWIPLFKTRVVDAFLMFQIHTLWFGKISGSAKNVTTVPLDWVSPSYFTSLDFSFEFDAYILPSLWVSILETPNVVDDSGADAVKPWYFVGFMVKLPCMKHVDGFDCRPPCLGGYRQEYPYVVLTGYNFPEVSRHGCCPITRKRLIDRIVNYFKQDDEVPCPVVPCTSSVFSNASALKDLDIAELRLILNQPLSFPPDILFTRKIFPFFRYRSAMSWNPVVVMIVCALVPNKHSSSLVWRFWSNSEKTSSSRKTGLECLVLLTMLERTMLRAIIIALCSPWEACSLAGMLSRMNS